MNSDNTTGLIDGMMAAARASSNNSNVRAFWRDIMVTHAARCHRCARGLADTGRLCRQGRTILRGLDGDLASAAGTVQAASERGRM